MFGFFSSKKEDKGPTPAEAIAKLRETEGILLKKQEVLEEKVNDAIKKAKANRIKNKRLAIQALKNKNKYEKQLKVIDRTLTNLETQREALEQAVSNVQVIETLKFGSESLKIAQKNYRVDQVHDVMDNIAEQLDVAKEISEAVSSSVAFGEDISEEDLEEELQQLEKEALDDEFIKIPSSLDLPTPADNNIEKENVNTIKKQNEKQLLNEVS